METTCEPPNAFARAAASPTAKRRAERSADVLATLRRAAANPAINFRYYITWVEEVPKRRRGLAKRRAVHHSVPCALIDVFVLRAGGGTESEVRVEFGIFVTEDGRYVKARVPMPSLNVLEFDLANSTTPVPTFWSAAALSEHIARFGMDRELGGPS